ncbi:MAG TPA: heavy metal sensor histidine kinase [Steroidobacteraceae bacterium]|nr:heavy metal sensor histidine kinase [Steroidobacteraceae bacterium]
MSTQLTLYYTASTCVLLTLASTLLYLALERSLLRENEAFLTHKMQVLSLILTRKPLDRAGLEQEVRDEAQVSARSQSPYLLRVLDGTQAILTETPGMRAAVPAAVFPTPRPQGAESLRWRSERRRYLLATMSVPADPPVGLRLQAALDIDAEIGLLERYRRDVIGLVLAGVLLAAALGAVITRRGLRPLATITRTTQRIGAERLKERLGPAAWPKELVALATEFDHMLERLQEAFERLSQFSADLAHELRTPINNLMGEAQVMLAHERTAEEHKRALQSSLEEHARLASMINSMLFLAQADQARLLHSPAHLDALAELKAVAEFYRPLADEQDVKLCCEGSCGVQADPLLLRRALSNLLSNALKATPRGGQVILRAAAGEKASTVLSVSDTGVGIAAECLPRLGERFYRPDPARTDGASGAGLGLAIVRSIMGLHGGELRIESSIGVGTTASLLFPPPGPLAAAT